MVSSSDAAPSTERGQRPDRLLHIQGLRGLFCSCIVVGHADPRPFPGAFAALDGFFLASGLVIGMLLLREHAKTGRVEFANFYLRRGRRLLPNLAVMLTVTALGTLLLLAPFGEQASGARTGLFASFQLSNFDLYRQPSGYYDVESSLIPLLHTWSLGVEEQVYLVLPATLALALLLAARLRWPGLRLFVWVVSVTTALSLALFVAWTTGLTAFPPGLNHEKAAFYFPVTRWWEVGIGVLLACWYAARPPLPRRVAAVVAMVGLVGLSALMVFPIADPAHRIGPLLLVPMGALVLILMGCRGESNPASRFLNLPVLVWLGDRAYSWYLWHLPVIVFARVWFADTPTVSLLAAAVSFGIAWLAYEKVEKPLRYPPRGQPRPQFVRGTSAIVAASLLVPATLFAGVFVASRVVSDQPAVVTMARQVEPRPISFTSGCSNPNVAFDPEQCTLNPDGSSAPIYVVGGSTTGMHTPALEALGEELDSPVVLMTQSNCPFILLDVTIGDNAGSCYASTKARAEWLEQQPPGVVFTASDDRMLTNGDVTLSDPETGRVAHDPADRRRMWQAAAQRTFAPLTASGQQLLMVSPLPRPAGNDDFATDWDARTCPAVRVLTDVTSCGRSVDRATALQETEDARRLVVQLARAVGGRTVDLFDALCPGDPCTTNLGSRWLFYDSEHITTTTSTSLAGRLRGPLASAVATAGAG